MDSMIACISARSCGEGDLDRGRYIKAWMGRKSVREFVSPRSDLDVGRPIDRDARLAE
jgi:hypothetical protein